MNIKETKEQVSNAITAYLTKDEFGNYCIPVEQQRPLCLIGPPGVGKTAIMEQVAAEKNVCLVSYSMTHHTRQSALGLPFIIKKTYGDKEYSVSEYTMSEIIASVYEAMEKTGVKEGILFLDEINCVSETLAPAMLQFLQYKVFGRHRVPDGWVVVTAGNPPEYNNSVREFDIVTWDRMKRVDVEPSFDVWKEYAYAKGVHASIMTYLDVKKDNFYKIETTVDGKSFVTARGWSDLSEMIKLYEKNGIEVDESLIAQYIQNAKLAKDFATYYDLFNKYKSDYQVDKILEGKESEDIRKRAKSSRFDERIALLGLILDAVAGGCKDIYGSEKVLKELLEALKNVKLALVKPGANAEAALREQIEKAQKRIESGKAASNLSADDERMLNGLIAVLDDFIGKLGKEAPATAADAFALIKNEFDARTKSLKNKAEKVGKQLSNAFIFCEGVFAGGQEILIFVTELTVNYYCAQFISRYGCKEYFAHNKSLLFHERQREIMAKLEELKLD